MLEKFLNLLMPVLFNLLPENIVKKGLESFLNTVEYSIKDSQNKIDDILLLPIIFKLREQLNIEAYNNPQYIPGDLANRKKALEKLLFDNNLNPKDVDMNLLNSFLLSPAGWQEKIGSYVQNILSKQ